MKDKTLRPEGSPLAEAIRAFIKQVGVEEAHRLFAGRTPGPKKLSLTRVEKIAEGDPHYSPTYSMAEVVFEQRFSVAGEEKRPEANESIFGPQVLGVAPVQGFADSFTPTQPPVQSWAR